MIIPPQRISIDYESVATKLQEICSNGQLTHGKYIERFESEWARFCGKKYCVTTNSCTSALEIAIRAMNIPKGKKIIVPTNTYGATVQACWNAGYQVELVDVQADLNMDIDKIPWSDDIGLVLMVFIGGNVPERIGELCTEAYDRGIPIITDSAHAHGSKGNTDYSDISCYSFFATKLITTFGEGGCLVTDDEECADFARRYRHHGRESDGMLWNHRHDGANMCMTEAQAIVGLDQLNNIHKFIATRYKVAEIYNEKFTPIFENGNYYKYIVPGRGVVKNRDITLSSPVYSKPIHQHSFWPVISKADPKYPVADDVCKNHFCLPIFNDMTIEEAKFCRDNVEVVE